MDNWAKPGADPLGDMRSLIKTMGEMEPRLTKPTYYLSRALWDAFTDEERENLRRDATIHIVRRTPHE